ncbi:type IV pilus assembly protein PilM [Patescibacteria group bacterium]|nr:type IV pilus assembly protein PilM [Patescibacteria group bacterium]
MFNIFKKSSSSYLGIDIGTTGMRIVQLGKKDKQIILENYVSIETEDYLEIIGSGSKFNNIRMSDKKIASTLAEIIRDSGLDSKKVSMSVPISSAFTSIVTLPEMPNSEIENAINFEARQYIPIPIEEVAFDWIVIEREGNYKTINSFDKDSKKKLKILLVAIPKEITNKYINIVNSLGLELIALETESFSLARALSRFEDGAVAIVDIGNKTTGVTVVEKGVVISGHSISGVGGEEITKIISHGVNVDYRRAEQLKMEVGFNNSNTKKQISDLILPTISVIVSEIIKINEAYVRTRQNSIKKVIITGRTAYISGLAKYFTKQIGIPTEIGFPWKNIVYNPVLEKRLHDSSQHFSVAVGLALRGFYDNK